MNSAEAGLKMLEGWEQLSPKGRVLCRALLWDAAKDNARIAATLGKLYLGQTDGGPLAGAFSLDGR